jgi:hypothetical protein
MWASLLLSLLGNKGGATAAQTEAANAGASADQRTQNIMGTRQKRQTTQGAIQPLSAGGGLNMNALINGVFSGAKTPNGQTSMNWGNYGL